MSQEAKSYIQDAALHRFSAQELWIRPDNHFWAFDIQDNRVVFIWGVYEDCDINFETETCYTTQGGESFMEIFVEQIIENGYECFAIQI